ncbi:MULTISPECIES: glycosyl hydrolase family 18 protein [Anaerostipes]|uniref:glycosyl hydrolase family 18 protein n=1 Tax=Anaerostipes TaxID=207244 RepID=UPI001C1E774F|nr:MULTISPECIES: glycosyl hydrolase family 18 protein [Anaerostipes]MCI5622105.1 glycosyl hydrolase family 18 protein [Anaerostipes sp.]MDY2727375.1 glycosyl hydrolase family 18 protein [Anaerostipes faecalis]
MIHVTEAGETIESIAYRYGVSSQSIIFNNQLRNEKLVIGQALLILIPEIVYEVSAGDSLFSISQKYGISIKQILRNNLWILQDSLHPGDVLVISYEESKKEILQIMGYAYPFILEEILNEVLLYVGKLLIFSYGFTRMGDLIPPHGEERLIQKAIKMGVDPILVLTPFSENGTFSNQLVKAVVEDLPMQERLIENLLLEVESKKYRGVDIDFEYILAENRDGYAAFVRNLREVMSAKGYQVSVALAPKISKNQPGLLYEGVDYKALGEAANTVFLMTYEWGYTYGPPMAVAPLNKVRQVLDYAVTEIPEEKILMGIPNYGYDWPLPYESGITKAETIGNVQAVERALEYEAVIEFDEIAKSPYFHYKADNIEHEVWFEDVRSIEAKIQLITSYGFLGAGYWNLMRPFRANWMYLNNMYILE